MGESPDDVGLLVKWFTRAKGWDTLDLRVINRFALDEDNTTTLIRLSDKYDIESLRCEINVSCKFTVVFNIIKVFYAFWLFADKIEPTYSLWEMAAIHGLEDVERYCRASAREKFKRIMEEGDGLKYFLRLGISADTLTTLIKEVYSRARPRPLKAEDIVLQQMAMAQS